MPELPDILAYLSALESRISGQTLLDAQIRGPFVLRTVSPSPAELVGKRVTNLGRIGKRIALGFEDDLFLVIHLMIAGRLQWSTGKSSPGGKIVLAAFRFEPGAMVLTEASTRKRASIHVVRTAKSLDQFDRGGVEVMECDLDSFSAALLRENHTLKRSLTDPRLFSGIGNAYSDEILHAARLSPFKLTSRISEEEIARLHEACRATLSGWIEKLRLEAVGAWPNRVTAFRDDMAVHGRYGQPCPVCGSPVQRISYAENECNYCAECQTGGKLLADRGLSRLLKSDWPRTIAELEELRNR